MICDTCGRDRPDTKLYATEWDDVACCGECGGALKEAWDEMTPQQLDRAGLVITPVQAQALADLLWEGKHTGTTLPDCDPPARVALVAAGEILPAMDGVLASNRDGSHRVNADGSVDILTDPPGHTLGVLADDGRTWQIVRAGICWPAESVIARGQKGQRA